MSEPARPRDAGLTLPDVLVAVVVLAMLGTVLAGAVVLSLRETVNSRGRVTIADAEQSLSLYLPNDMASATELDGHADASPCEPECPPDLAIDGDNALLLRWSVPIETGEGRHTNVSYRTVPERDHVQRVRCDRPEGTSEWDCTAQVLLAGVSGSLTTDDCAAGDEALCEVVLAIDGGGRGEGRAGGANERGLATVMTDRTTIAPDSTHNAPTLDYLCRAGLATVGCPDD